MRNDARRQQSRFLLAKPFGVTSLLEWALCRLWRDRPTGFAAALARVQVLAKSEKAADGGNSGKNQRRIQVVAREESSDLPRVKRSQTGDQKVTDAAAERERGDKFLGWVLESAGSE